MTKQLRDSVLGCHCHWGIPPRTAPYCCLFTSETLNLTSIQQQNLIKQYNKNHVLQDHMIVLCFLQQQIQYKSNIQTEKQQCQSQVFGFWHWKQLFFVSHFHSLLSFYPRLISPANRVISKIIVNPVSSPAFWIRKNATFPR